MAGLPKNHMKAVDQPDPTPIRAVSTLFQWVLLLIPEVFGRYLAKELVWLLTVMIAGRWSIRLRKTVF